ncbi:MAG: hypothetical protein ABL962_04180 [Fimbriimonadaceae bacterium]
MENAFMVPILPGKTEAALAFARTLSEERRADMDQAQVSVTKESWFLQRTPIGDFLIVYVVSPDPMAVHVALAESQEPFDLWFKEQVLDISGLDISTPMPELPVQVLDWSRS